MRKPSDISIQYVKGVGPARKSLFAKLGIETIEDLLYFFPRRYEDRTQLTPLNKLKVGEYHTVTGKILARGGRRSWYTRKHVYESVIGDEHGRLSCIWFNQPYLENYFKVGERVVLYGKVEAYKDRLQMVAPEYELIGEEDEALSMGRIVPIYPLTRGFSQRYLRRVIKTCLESYAGDLRDALPFSIRNKFHLMNIVLSLNHIHFPESLSLQQEAYKRIAFEEFFFFQVSVILRRLSIVQREGIGHRIPEGLLEDFLQAFPFPLTNDQIKVIEEIAEDMKRNSPMLRLLQGDVGSGKTVVALFGAVVAFHNGFQSAIMAPTEILARQHFEVIQKFIHREQGPFKKMRLCLLTSQLKRQQKEKISQDIKEGALDLVVGTHALLQKEITFKNLSFVVIDEQHKFGIRQRALLSAKGINPDCLIMTATPIPRTLCLTLYGDLDVSIIQELPPGRGGVQTRYFPQERSPEVYGLVADLVKEGRQAFVVYPLVEESKKLDLKAAEESFQHFQKHEFKDFRLGLIHGRMSRKESERIMDGFQKKEIDILVATTVVEVGVDVPNASVMVIEHAERFGLSQLHQLRGRIGRGAADAFCFLIGEPTTEEAKARVQAILSTHDGFKIAEADLLIRGPGEFFGRHQHGLNELKVANPATQLDILELARREALALTQADPHLRFGANALIKEVVRKRYPTYLAMAEAG